MPNSARGVVSSCWHLGRVSHGDGESLGHWGVIGDLMQVLAQSTCYSSSTFFKAEAL